MDITLEQMLESRDTRAAFQKTLLAGCGLPLISFTVNMPGPHKAGDKARCIFEAGVLALRERLAGSIRYSKLKDLPTGPEGFFAVDMAAPALKAVTCELEGRHPLGRLMDMDVLEVNGQIIDRKSIGLSPRCCLICGAPGPGCARSRAHSLEALYEKIDAMLAEWRAACG